MWTLISLEIFKIRKKLRSYLGFAGLLGIAVLMAVGLRYGPSPGHHMLGSMPRGMLVVGSLLTAGFMTSLIMQGTLFTFLPLFVSMVAGDMVSGEAADGTLRTAMSRPVSRLGFFVAKLFSSGAYAVALTFFLGLSAYVIGLIALGRGPVAVGWSGFAVYPEVEGITRLLAAYALACVPMIAVAAIALFISTIVNSSPAAIIGPMILIFGLTIIGEIGYFEPVKPYLFTTYLDVWKEAFAPRVDWGHLRTGLEYLCAYIAIFGGLAALIFCRKDILT